MSKFTAAVVQAAPIAFDSKATTEKAVRLIGEAAKKGASLVVFPEAYIPAYPKRVNYSVGMGVRTPEVRELFKRYFESSIDVPGPEVSMLAKAVKQANVHLVIGVIEREIGTLYCTILFFSNDGTLLGKHRKVMPTATERMVWGFGDGSTMPVIDTPLGKIAAVTCWENYMPMMRMAMYAKGVTLYCAPTADDRDTWVPSMQHIALEGRCYVLSSCQFARRSDFPEDYLGGAADKQDEILMRGGSVIVDPLGKVIAGPNFAEECVLTAEIDTGDIARAKFDLDVSGHYARPDIFQLRVDERPKAAVLQATDDEPWRA